MRDEQGFVDFAAARTGSLQRQAYLLTGSADRAGRVTERALAETGRRWDKLGGAVAAEEHARKSVLAAAVRSRAAAPATGQSALGTALPTDDPGEAVWRALAGLPPRRRAVLVLRYDEGLDDVAVGARLGVPAATAAAEGEAGLAALRSLLRRRGRPEELLRPALDTAAREMPPVPVPAGGGAPAAEGAVRHPPVRRRWMVAGGVVVVVAAVAAAVLIPALNDDPVAAAPGSVPAARADGAGQLPWDARGPLAGDQELLRAALRTWRDGVPERQRPATAAALYAGAPDGARAVLLQGTDPAGQSWVAELTDTGGGLTLDRTEPLGRAVPLLALRSRDKVRLLAAPPAAGATPALVVVDGTAARPLGTDQDGLSEPVAPAATGLRVAVQSAGAVTASGTVLAGTLSPVTGDVELAPQTVGLGAPGPLDPVWYADGALLSGRLAGPVAVAALGPDRTTAIRVNGRARRVDARAYEAVRGGTRYLATVVRVDGAPTCVDTAAVGPAGAAPNRAPVLVSRCVPARASEGLLLAVAAGDVRTVQVRVAAAAKGRPARVVTVSGSSGAGLVGLVKVAGLPAAAAPVEARTGSGRVAARFILPAYKGPKA